MKRIARYTLCLYIFVSLSIFHVLPLSQRTSGIAASGVGIASLVYLLHNNARIQELSKKQSLSPEEEKERDTLTRRFRIVSLLSLITTGGLFAHAAGTFHSPTAYSQAVYSEEKDQAAQETIKKIFIKELTQTSNELKKKKDALTDESSTIERKNVIALLSIEALLRKQIMLQSSVIISISKGSFEKALQQRSIALEIIRNAIIEIQEAAGSHESIQDVAQKICRIREKSLSTLDAIETQ